MFVLINSVTNATNIHMWPMLDVYISFAYFD